MLTYWIQKADLSTAVEDEVVTSASLVLSAFDNFDWQAELNNFEQLGAKGVENCPPGLGVVRPNGVILHLCPNSDESVMAFWHHKVPSKLLGFINSTRIETTTVENLELKIAREAINRFIKGDDEWLIRNFKDN